MVSTRALLLMLSVWLLPAWASSPPFHADAGPVDVPKRAVDEGPARSDSFGDASGDRDAPKLLVDSAADLRGSWTLTATNTQQCSKRSFAGSYQAVVRFEPVPDAIEGGSEFLLDPGLGCWLPMVVQGNVAQLGPPSVQCASPSEHADLEFTSVQVKVTGAGIDVHETVRGSCDYAIDGILWR